MSINSTIRNINFAQGVDVTGAFKPLEESRTYHLENNVTNFRTDIIANSSVCSGMDVDLIVRRYTSEEGEMIENISYRLFYIPSEANATDRWRLAKKYKSDEGKSTGVSLGIGFFGIGDEATLTLSTTDIEGDDHDCTVYVLTKIFFNN